MLSKPICYISSQLSITQVIDQSITKLIDRSTFLQFYLFLKIVIEFLIQNTT